MMTTGERFREVDGLLTNALRNLVELERESEPGSDIRVMLAGVRAETSQLRTRLRTVWRRSPKGGADHASAKSQ